MNPTQPIENDISLSLQQQKDEIVARYGRWSAHNICLSDDTYTIDKRVVGDEIKLRRILQLVVDYAGKPLDQLRVLDLACLEGLYSIECALQGAEVVAIEGREAHLQKARFASNQLGLENVEFRKGDVRDISRKELGEFDVVLCLGILYHIDAEHICSFIESISDLCRGVAIYDTHISIADKVQLEHKGRTYAGRHYYEYNKNTPPERVEKAIWASLDNPTSFWFTRASLVNVLIDSGFTSVCECHAPVESNKETDRVTMIARKGAATSIRTNPLLDDTNHAERFPEKSIRRVHPMQKRYHIIRRACLDCVPFGIRQKVKSWLQGSR